MSGLKVLGAVASAVQLADTCLKIATCAVDLFSRIRDAPETIRKRIVAVDQLVEIARLIEHNPSLQTPLIASVLARARAEAEKLQLETTQKQGHLPGLNTFTIRMMPIHFRSNRFKQYQNNLGISLTQLPRLR